VAINQEYRYAREHSLTVIFSSRAHKVRLKRERKCPKMSAKNQTCNYKSRTSWNL